ncbi:MAG: DUF3553 domain-containing protein [Paracoccaceae bacterium]
MGDANEFLEPGMLVRNPAKPDWGQGQVQSSIPGRITVTFENVGKMVLDPERVKLEVDLGTRLAP